MSVICDHCGSCKAKAIDKPDCTRIDCPVCGSTEFIWKDNEYEWDDDLDLEPHISVDGYGEDGMP